MAKRTKTSRARRALIKKLNAKIESLSQQIDELWKERQAIKKAPE